MIELTEKEEKMLSGEKGDAKREAMEILVALAKIYNAEKMIPVKSVQVSGVSYKTIGEAGLIYVKKLAEHGARVVVPTFLNPAGMDCLQWQKMGVPKNFADRQMKIIRSYSKMGIELSCTCTPYLAGVRPKKGEHIAWAESSAVVFANSVLGARTNREGGPSALAAAICGVTPNYGLHLDENRIAEVLVDVKAKLKSINDYSAMGYYIGKLVGQKHPAFKGIPGATEDQLKSLGAAMAASGAVALFYAKGRTPEWKVSDSPEKISFTEKELKETKEELDSEEKPELVTIGCPHASLKEIAKVTKLVSRKKPDVHFWVCTSRKVRKKAVEKGYVKKIEKAGGLVLADTCMVVSPIWEMGFRVSAANSAKAAKYLRNLCHQRVCFGTTKDILYRRK